MTHQDTQPPAETLAEATNRLQFEADFQRRYGSDRVSIRRDDADTILAALTRRAGGDAIPDKVLRTIATTLPIGATDAGRSRRVRNVDTPAGAGDPDLLVGDVGVAVEYMLGKIPDLPSKGSPQFQQIVSALTRGYVFGRCSRGFA